jgi:hypothetical protein
MLENGIVKCNWKHNFYWKWTYGKVVWKFPNLEMKSNRILEYENEFQNSHA